MKGKFIVFEGCEGVGKSTQLRLLKEYLEKTGQKAVFTREPGGTPVGEKIRSLLLGEEMSAESEALLSPRQDANISTKLSSPLWKGANSSSATDMWTVP